MSKSEVNKTQHRQKKRGRGNIPRAKLGNLESLKERIQFESDKFDVEVANNLERYYQDLLDMADAKGKWKNIGTKDRMKVIYDLIQHSEDFLEDIYSEEEQPKKEDDSEKNEKPDEEPKTLAPLISFDVAK